MSERSAAISDLAERSGRRFADFTCTSCGLFCDDLVVAVTDDHAIDPHAIGCALARHAFEVGNRHRASIQAAPEAAIGGLPATRSEALNQAARRLAEARSPVILGPVHGSIETQRATVALADRLGASIDAGSEPSQTSRWIARQRAGWVSATWGEIQQRADLLIVWQQADLHRAWPRFGERFLDPPGRFMPRGRTGRSVVLVTSWSDPNAHSNFDQSLPVAIGSDLAALSALRALIRGRRVDGVRLEAATGLPLSVWQELAGQLSSARYAVLLSGPTFALGASTALLEALAQLASDVNAFGSGRCVWVELAGGGNPAGLDAVLGWQAGAPGPVDFRLSSPRGLPYEAEGRLRIELDQTDVILTVGQSTASPPLPPVEAVRSGKVPWIHLADDATIARPDGVTPSIALATADPWLESEGTVMRSDGVCVPLTPILPRRRPAACELVGEILARVEALQRETGS
jgi:formylmethanofuran dehydrogenase subunit B